MPKLNHNTFGCIAKTVYLPGRILKVYPEDEDHADSIWDTADVEFASTFSPHGDIWQNVPIFYHCRDDVTERPNGALVGAADGFDEGDQVIIMAHLATSKITDVAGNPRQFESAMVVGHKDGPKICRPGWIFLFCTIGDVQFVTVFSIRANRVLEGLVDAELNPYHFPCPVDVFKPWLDRNIPSEIVDEEMVYQWPCSELFEQIPVEIENQIQVAGGTPNWMDDFQGNIIRGSATPSSWWTSSNFRGNPTFNHFLDTQIQLLADAEGIADGTFSRALNVANRFDSHGWTGPGVVVDHRRFIPPTLPRDQVFTSTHRQVGYGEDEIWVCGRNTYEGLIVSYCDQMWKYVRHENVPPALPIGNPALNRLIGKAGMAAAMPGAGAVFLLPDVAMALAADTTQSVPHGSLILICATLKRLNEGAFHHDHYPLVSGSLLLKTLPNRAHPEEPIFEGFLGVRHENIDVWVRFDNWHNTLQYSYSLGEANRTWWFRVWATQTAWQNEYWDTPLGSIFLRAPYQRSVLWQSSGLTQGTITVRQDWPIRTRQFSMSRQHEKSLVQVYVVHRQGVTLDGKPEDMGSAYFFRQRALIPPWDCLPELEEIPDEEVPEEIERDADLNLPEPNEYVGFLGDRHITEMSDGEIGAALDDLVFIHSESTERPNPLRRDRNEIEIVAGADMWGNLFLVNEDYSPFSQERNPQLEQAIKELIQATIAEANAGVFAEMQMEVRLV